MVKKLKTKRRRLIEPLSSWGVTIRIKDDLLKIEDTFAMQSVRKSGMVVLVYDSVDKMKKLGK
jgi:hypothetical protein